MEWIAIAFVALGVIRFAYIGVRAMRSPKVATSAGGISVRGHHFKAFIAWNDIQAIAVSRYPTATVDVFCVELYVSDDNAVAIFDGYSGFDTLRTEIFKRWPQIEDDWPRVFMGPPTEREIVTLWRRGQA